MNKLKLFLLLPIIASAIIPINSAFSAPADSIDAPVDAAPLARPADSIDAPVDAAPLASPPTWIGTWLCNHDGRPATIIFNSINPVRGRVNIAYGGWTDIEERTSNSKDVPNSNQAHILHLSGDWLLMRHGWDANYASGYSIWNGVPFGLQCRRGIVLGL